MNDIEQIFQLTFEKAAVGMAHVDREGHFIRVNQKLTEITGYPKENLLQKTFQEITHPDDLKEDLKYAEALKCGEIDSYGMEKRYFRKNGDIVWIKLTGSAVTDKKGDLDFFIAIIEDISKQKQAEEALQKSEQRFKLAAAAAKIGTYSRNLKSGENYWSPEFLEIYGLDPGSTLPMKDGIPAAVHPDDREEVIAEARARFDRKLAPEFNNEHRIILPDGEVRWVIIRGRMDFDDHHNPTYIHGVVMDITENKRVRKALRDSEARYGSLFKFIDEGFCVFEMIYDEKGHPVDYRFLETNPAFENQTGLSDAIGKTILELLPNHESYWFEIYGKVAETGESERFQKRGEGMNRWFDIFAFRIGDPENRTVAALFTDISLRIEAEKARHESEKRYRLLFENMSEGFALAEMIWDENGNPINWRYLQVNQAWGQTGVPAHETIGRTAREVNPNIEDYWIKTYGNVVRTGKPVSYENYAAGFGKWFATYAFKHSDNHFALLFHDITAKKQAEEALRESEEKFRLIANNISQMAWIGNSKGRIFWYNKRWFDYTGYSSEEIEDWGWKKLIHPDHLERVIRKLNHSWEKEEVWEDLFPLKSKNKQYRWFLFHAIPVQDEKKNTVRWFGTATDFTRQIEIEDQLKKDKELVENLLYIAAHDLRGPVANIQGALNLMKNMPTEQKLNLLDHFPDLADQLDKTIIGITDILRVRSTDESSAKRIGFEEILNEIIPEFREELSSSSLHYDFSEKKAIFYIEPFLYSIMKNLISNAIKYCPDDVPLKIDISSKRKDNNILLQVRDNGIGIDLERYGDKLFSPFQRFSSEKARGTGIGLYLVKNIIEKNGGYIKVKSTPGKGTTFNCYLMEY